VETQQRLVVPDAAKAAKKALDSAGSDWERQVWRSLIGVLTLSHSPVLLRWLDVADQTLRDSGIAERIAETLFGDALLVYDCTARLMSEGMPDASDALNGPTPGFEELPGETLARFIKTNGRGVIVLDDLQAFEERAVEILASIVDDGMAYAEGTGTRRVRAHAFAVLARARIGVPSGQTLAKDAAGEEWAQSTHVPHGFASALEEHARTMLPKHFAPWVVGRFGMLRSNAAFERYRQLLAAGRGDRPIFESPLDASVPPAKTGLPPRPHNLVKDVQSIPLLTPDPGLFDVFISYSWARTAEAAVPLRDALRRRGYRVFLDRDHLQVDEVPEAERKEFLIQRLLMAVQSSRSCIVFAAAKRPYIPTPGFDDEQAVRRGLAMLVERDVQVEWSWQALELRHANRYLMLGANAASAINNGSFDHSFGTRSFSSNAEMETIVLEYLAREGVMPG
jgi:hypothetical protein